MLEVARAMGLRSLVQDGSWYGLSLTLGGGEVTLLDLTTAYHTLANEGRYLPSRAIREVRDSQERLIEEWHGPEPAPVLAAGSAFIITDILSDNVARTPAFGGNSPLRLSEPAAVKTGTTNDFRDNWTVGYTRYLVAGVWAGNSDGRPMRGASGVTGAAPMWQEFMEKVLNDPLLLATMEVAGEWDFYPPPDVVQLVECPPGLQCRQGGEYFSLAWLGKYREQGALGDSVVEAPIAPVYVQEGEDYRLAGFCEMEGAAVRRLLAIPGWETPPGLLPLISVEQENGAVAMRYSLEQQHAIAWSLRRGGIAYLGSCDDLAAAVPAALMLADEAGEQVEALRILVDLAGAAEPLAVEFSPATAVELAVMGSEEEVAILVRGDAGLVQPMEHDWSCPGQYVMGRVINGEGMPLAGVRVIMRDPWGNQQEAFSKDGPGDYGMFDFPIFGDGPMHLFVQVVDEGGNPIGAEVVIPHKLDPVPDAPCHHVVLQVQ
jgi:hypothetical protein